MIRLIIDMPRINVKIKNRTEKIYDIQIENGCFSKIPSFLSKQKDISKICIITDHNLLKLYTKKLHRELKKLKLTTIVLSINPGEKSKNRLTKAELENKLLEHKFDRHSVIIALGGGVIGDISGYLASTYLRGIHLIHVPTSLLAMVDSSIGGKNAISLSNAKNIIGTFYQPRHVFIDPNFLKTLPKQEIINGLVEALKTGLVMDKQLFEYIESNYQKIIKLNKSAINHIITESVKNKVEITSKDEKESGIRQILNYGHTIGHAIEALARYKIPHGQCVAIGMRYAGDIAVILKLLTNKERNRQNQLLKNLGLTLDIPTGIIIDEIIETIKLDKKVKKSKPRFILLKNIGKVYTKNSCVDVNMDRSIIKKALISS